MSRIKKIMIAMFISTAICAISYGQDAETSRMKQQADSLQRIKMKDSLGISDEIVTAIFATRDSLMNKVVQLGESQTIDAAGKAIGIANAREQTNEKIKETLGETIYKKYLQMIRSRLDQRQSVSSLPLAGETENK